MAGTPWWLVRSRQIRGHEVRDLALRDVHREGMPAPGRGALRSILFFRKFFGKETTLGRILCDRQTNATFMDLQEVVSLAPTLLWSGAVTPVLGQRS